MKDILCRNEAFIADLESEEFDYEALTAKYGYSKKQIDKFRWKTGKGEHLRGRKRVQYVPTEALLIDLKEDKHTNQFLSEKHGCTIKQIHGFRSKRNLPTSPVDNQFFKNRNADFFYFLGWIASDGTVTGSNLIQLCLKSTDIGMLESIKEMIGYKREVGTYTSYSKQTEKQHTSSMISFTSKVVTDMLAEYGIGHRKSLTLQYPENIPEDMTRHFVRGVYDGDGSIFKTQNLYRVIFSCGCKQFLESLSTKLYRHLEVDHRPVTQGHGCFTLGYYKQQQVRRFLDWIYEGTTERNRLARKYEKYQEFCNENPCPNNKRRKRRSQEELKAAGHVSKAKPKNTKTELIPSDQTNPSESHQCL